MITKQNITKHELIGLHAKIVEAKNPLTLKIAGKIIDETRDTLVILHNGKAKRVFKGTVVLEIKLPAGELVKIAGSKLQGRPWERIRK